jgi:3-hydroxyanthranilate 3,4-dioxygenase
MAKAEPLKPVKLEDWIAENPDGFRKPVSNQLVWENGDFIAFVSAGNSRNDFHINPGDEIFVQVKGDVRVDLQVDGERVINELREGEVLLVPAGVPHAPRRPEGTFGFVVERVRRPGELDAFAWHCENCNNQLHRVEFQLEDIIEQFAQCLRDIDADEAARTCDACGEVLEVHTDFTLDSQLVPGARAGM